MSTQEEQLVVAGDEAEALLSAPAFNSVINETVNTAFTTFVNTDADKPGDRELVYTHYRAIIDVVDTLKQRVEVRNSILTKQRGDNSQEEIAL